MTQSPTSMRLTSKLLICVLVLSALCVGCTSTESDNANQQVIANALNLSTRSQADIERDQRSQPAEVLKLLQLSSGQVVMDIFAGAGYYSEIMANIVGPEGKVLMHNNKAYRDFVRSDLEERLANLKLPQLETYDREVNDFGLQSNSLDAAMIIMSYHDLYYDDADNGWPAIDSDSFFKQLHAALKPNGKFLIVDHNAAENTGNSSVQPLHRIEESFAIQDIESRGFTLAGSSNALRNQQDDLTLTAFDEKVRGKTDRFILLFNKTDH